MKCTEEPRNGLGTTRLDRKGRHNFFLKFSYLGSFSAAHNPGALRPRSNAGAAEDSQRAWPPQFKARDAPAYGSLFRER
jgi:hypothetical protein